MHANFTSRSCLSLLQYNSTNNTAFEARLPCNLSQLSVTADTLLPNIDLRCLAWKNSCFILFIYIPDQRTIYKI